MAIFAEITGNMTNPVINSSGRETSLYVRTVQIAYAPYDDSAAIESLNNSFATHLTRNEPFLRLNTTEGLVVLNANNFNSLTVKFFARSI